MAPALEPYLAGGCRKDDTWLAQLHVAKAGYSGATDTFVNVKDPDERQRLEATRLSATGLH